MRLHSTSGFVRLVHEEVEEEQPAAKKKRWNALKYSRVSKNRMRSEKCKQKISLWRTVQYI